MWLLSFALDIKVLERVVGPDTEGAEAVIHIDLFLVWFLPFLIGFERVSLGRMVSSSSLTINSSSLTITSSSSCVEFSSSSWGHSLPDSDSDLEAEFSSLEPSSPKDSS